MDIVCLLFDGITALDIVGPYEVLQRLPEAEVKFVARSAGEIRQGSEIAGTPVCSALARQARAQVELHRRDRAVPRPLDRHRKLVPRRLEPDEQEHVQQHRERGGQSRVRRSRIAWGHDPRVVQRNRVVGDVAKGLLG